MDSIDITPHDFLTDERGWFIKMISGSEKGLFDKPGEIYVTAAFPGQSKGGDYSLTTNKWFMLIKGRATMVLEDISTGERATFELNANKPSTIYVPCKVANIIHNQGNEECILLVYADNYYDKNDIICYSI